MGFCVAGCAPEFFFQRASQRFWRRLRRSWSLSVFLSVQLGAQSFKNFVTWDAECRKASHLLLLWRINLVGLGEA